MARISIVGAGHVGITLGRLLRAEGHQLGEVCNRSLPSAQAAVKKMGGGKPVADIGDMAPGDILIIATGDNALETIANALLPSPAISHDMVVFHCSGATQAETLASLRAKGAAIASVHPVKTFALPESDAETFPGTWCGMEGDAAALAVLRPLFESIGGLPFDIESQHKPLYHAAVVFMCNYLFPLIEAGLVCYERAGVSRAVAIQIVAPILHATVGNALRLGPAKALTGPIARGDDQVVARHIEALGVTEPDLKHLYQVLGRFTVPLALAKGAAPADRLQAIDTLLRGA